MARCLGMAPASVRPYGVAEVVDSDAAWGEDVAWDAVWDAAWGIPMLTAQGCLILRTELEHHTLRIHILLCLMANTTGDKKGNLIL